MSRLDPIAAIRTLESRAKTGNKQALAELRKLRIALATQQALVSSTLPDEDIVGAEPEVFAPDDLDVAANIAGQHADDLARKVALRGHKWTDLHEVAPFARNNPPSVLQGITGNQAIVTSGGPAIEVANWGGHDAETQPVTVTVYPVQQLSAAPPATPVTARPFAIVQYGTKGFLVRVEVDIGLGCDFTLSASSVTLQVAMDPPIPAGPVAGTMKLSGMLSFWPVVRTKPITRTIYVDTLAGGGANVIVPIPAAAKDVLVVTDSTALQLFVLDVNGIGIYTFFTPVAPAPNPGIMLQPVILSGDAVSIDVINNGALPAQARLIFGLEL